MFYRAFKLVFVLYRIHGDMPKMGILFFALLFSLQYALRRNAKWMRIIKTVLVVKIKLSL